MLLAGGGATVNSLTGIHPVAAIFLLPLGVTAYTLIGGLKATLLTDYLHTIMMFIIILLFAFTAYATSDAVGSPAKMYELLLEASQAHPVEGNKDGSYLTMRSDGGIKFFVINIGKETLPRKMIRVRWTNEEQLVTLELCSLITDITIRQSPRAPCTPSPATSSVV